MKSFFLSILLLGCAQAAFAGSVQLQLPSTYQLTGHSCGGAPHIDPAQTSWSADGNYFTTYVQATTYCSSGGRGSIGRHFWGSAVVTYDLSGNIVSETITMSNYALPYIQYNPPYTAAQGDEPPFVNPVNGDIEVTFYHWANLADVLTLVSP